MEKFSEEMGNFAQTREKKRKRRKERSSKNQATPSKFLTSSHTIQNGLDPIHGFRAISIRRAGIRSHSQRKRPALQFATYSAAIDSHSPKHMLQSPREFHQLRLDFEGRAAPNPAKAVQFSAVRGRRRDRVADGCLGAISDRTAD